MDTVTLWRQVVDLCLTQAKSLMDAGNLDLAERIVRLAIEGENTILHREEQNRFYARGEMFRSWAQPVEESQA